MTPMRWPALFLLVLACACDARPAGSDGALLGAWRLDDGRVMTLAPSADGTWRYRFVADGRSGRLHPGSDGWQAGPGFSDREPRHVVARQEAGDRLRWAEADRPEQRAARIAVREQPLEFASAGTTLRGRLVLPPAAGPHPVVVLVHGSERTPAVGQWHDPYLLAAHGIAAFVYDKRGTGGSDGGFTADFGRLADDAAAAATRLAGHPDIDPARIGFAGFSQGGWVAPLAAERFGRARAVLVGYGAVDSPLFEDRWQCLSGVRAGGGDAAALEEADRLVSASHVLLRSGLQAGWPEFTARVAQYRDRAWFGALDDERCIAAGFAAYPAWIVRAFAGRRLPPDIDWDHDSHALLQRLDVPMLWLLAGDDTEAPADDTARVLDALAARGKPYRTVVLPGTDHGMLTYRMDAGQRVPTGYHPEYFRRMVAFWQAQFAPAPDPG